MMLEKGTVADLEGIATFVEECCEGCITDIRTLYHVKLAVDEACTNVFEHAYRGAPGRVEVEVECTPARVVMMVRDWGASFDPPKVKSPDPSLPLLERPVGGLGMFLMQQVMDRVEYCFDPKQGNVLILEKKLAE